jgi:hypothetical protein
MSAEHLHAKFMDCAASAPRPPDPARAQAIVDTVMGLERLTDVAALMRLLA